MARPLQRDTLNWRQGKWIGSVVLFALSVIFGVFVGFALGLTGGGGSIFAVPLLVYGLSVGPQQAVGMSLAAVGATAFLGAMERLRAREVEVRAGLLFSTGGVMGAPVGTWTGTLLPSAVLLVLFAGLMLVIASHMWLKSIDAPAPDAGGPLSEPRQGILESGGRSCGVENRPLAWSAHHVITLGMAGLVTGLLSGLFGVGGGFVIVPALVLFGGMAMHSAIATSLLAIAVVSAAGLASYLWDGGKVPWESTALFVVGGVLGLEGGVLLSHRLSGPRLQRVFAVAIVLVATFILFKTLL